MNCFFDNVFNISSEDILLRRLTRDDAESLRTLTDNDNVYKYLPTFLYEKKYDDIYRVIDGLYTECIEDSLILGIFDIDASGKQIFMGLAEFYDYKEDTHSISLGCRYIEDCWDKGIAKRVLAVIVDYLFNETDIEIITSSSRIENKAAYKVLSNEGFELIAHGAEEDWGFPTPTIADKWVLKLW